MCWLSYRHDGEKGCIMYNVYMCAMSACYVLLSFDNYDDAYQFYVDNNWEWMDENDFVWTLDIDAQ